MRKVFLTVMTLGVLTFNAWSDHIPAAPEGVLEFSGRVGVMLDVAHFDPFLELQASVEDEDHELRYRALTMGTYYRLHKNLKVGGFYRLQAGARHDDDWVDLHPGWEWEDSRGRLEHVLIADISPRFLLDFLPGEAWVFMLKNRYLYNTFNSHHALIFRPSLTYFLMRNRQPLFNFSIQYELYLALNFGQFPPYRQYPYINVLYHLTPNVILEASGAYKTVKWSTSQDLIDLNRIGYAVEYRAWVIGLGALFKFEL